MINNTVIALAFGLSSSSREITTPFWTQDLILAPSSNNPQRSKDVIIILLRAQMHPRLLDVSQLQRLPCP